MQLYLWYGDNDFDLTQTANSWVEAFNKKHSGLNIVKLDYKNDSSDKLILELKNSLQVNSLFGSNKLIILKDFLTKELNNEVQELLLKYFENLAETFFVIFIQKQKPDSRTKIFKTIQKLQKANQAEIKEFVLPSGFQLSSWLKQRLQKYQTTMTEEAMQLLIAMVGQNLWQLDLELQKLSNYKKGEQIQKADVSLLVKGKFNDDIFQLMDAIGHKNKALINTLIKDQLDSGANEMYLFTMLVRQFRLILMVKELMQLQPGADKNFIARELKLHPFVAQKTMQQAGLFELNQLKQIYSQLLEFEINLKTGSLDFRLLFDKFISQL